MSTASLRIFILAGGTGGHISPGVALGESFLQAGVDVVLLSSRRNTGNPDLASLAGSAPVYYLDPPEFPRRPWHILSFSWRLVSYILRLRRIISGPRTNRATQPVFIGMGGYTSFPGLLYARLGGHPFYLCEQNCVPGKVTRLFQKKARAVFTSFPLSRPLKKSTRINEVGNPVRSRVLAALKDNPSQRQPKTLLAMGGSQGARQINSLVRQLAEASNGMFESIILITGPKTFPDYEDLNQRPNVKVLAYEPAMEKRFLQSDLVLARSGAGLLAEASLFGLPMILVPYPYAADNHQEDNARYAVEAGAAKVLSGKEIDPTELNRILEECTQPPNFTAMSQAALAMGRPNAGPQIVTAIQAELGAG